MSRFENVEEPPKLEAFYLNKKYWEDPSPSKVNLATGVYRTDAGSPFVLAAVRRAERLLADDDFLNHDYQPTLGPDSFRHPACRLLLGEDADALLREGRAFGMQTVSGTGALRLGADFLVQQLGYRTFYYSDPTWSGRLLARWHAETKSFAFQGMLADLRDAPHVRPQPHWHSGLQERGLFPFFDNSFQGLAFGDLDEDAWSLRHFVGRGFELFCAQSFSKNFGLYSERVGNLLMVLKTGQHGDAVRGQCQMIVRGSYSYPADHGGRVVSTILSDTRLYQEWKNNLNEMCDRFRAMRRALVARLHGLGTPGNWDHITSQVGMICATGLTPDQCNRLVNQFHVYILSSGRINISGLNSGNVDDVAKAIHEVSFKDTINLAISSGNTDGQTIKEGSQQNQNTCFPQ